MATWGVFIPNIPYHWASYAAIEYLFEWHKLGRVCQVKFNKSQYEFMFDATIYFSHWYNNKWAQYIYDTVLECKNPAYVSLLYSNDFLSLYKVRPNNNIKEELIMLRRHMGLQCMTCFNKDNLEEDDDEYGKFYCRSCWFERNNEEAIRAKERDIDNAQLKINNIWSSDDPHKQYLVEQLLQDIQERNDEIKELRSVHSLMDGENLL